MTFVWGMTCRDVCYDVTHSFSTNHKTATEIFCVEIRAEDWVGYPIYYCKTQSLGGSFTMQDPNLWAQLNYVSTQTQWGWVHFDYG